MLRGSMRIVLPAAVLLVACGSEAPAEPGGSAGRTFVVRVGHEFEIRLQSIGPGEYRAPPSISSGAIRFHGATLATPPVPAGLTPST